MNKLEDRYVSGDGAEFQLNRTLVDCKIGLVYLSFVDGWVANITSLIDGVVIKADIREIDISFKPLELGYYGRGRTCEYLRRQPLRQWRAGLSLENIIAGKKRPFKSPIKSREMLSCVLGHHPSLREAYSMLYEYSIVPYHRHYALSMGKGIQILYKGEDIGYITGEGHLSIQPSYTFLKEELEEIVDGHCD